MTTFDIKPMFPKSGISGAGFAHPPISAAEERGAYVCDSAECLVHFDNAFDLQVHRAVVQCLDDPPADSAEPDGNQGAFNMLRMSADFCMRNSCRLEPGCMAKDDDTIV